MADINLLPVEEKTQESFNQLQKKISLVSVILLAVVAVFTVVTLVFFTALSRERQGLVSDISASTTSINKLKSQEEFFVVVKSKVSAADSILDARINHAEVFRNFSQLVPKGVYFTDLKFTEKITMSGKARTSADVAGLVSRLLSSEGSKVVSGVSVDSLSSDETGVYVFAMSAALVN